MSESRASVAGDTKATLRSVLIAARRARPQPARDAAAEALAARVLALPEVRAARTVTAYVSRPVEPGTGALLDALAALGTRVLLPVLVPGLDLDWAVHEGAAALVPCELPGNGSLLEPSGPRLGLAAIAEADVVLAPGLAVGMDGVRLGHGGGCYDRAVGRLVEQRPVVTLLYDDEILTAVPAEPHDRRVDAAVTPQRTLRFH
jgi:5-formyltetrahydrofolate cyclo-ligase